MTTKTTLNCVKYLLNHGMKFSDILASNPTVSMRTLCSPRLTLGKHVACHTETSNTSSVDWFNWFYKTESPTEIAGQIKHIRFRTSHKHWRRFQKSFSPNLYCNLFIHNLTIIDQATLFILTCLSCLYYWHVLLCINRTELISNGTALVQLAWIQRTLMNFLCNHFFSVIN